MADKVIDAYETILNTKPNNANAFHYLAIAYGEQEEYDKAIVSYKKAISIEPDNASTHYNLASAYACQNEESSAIESLQKAITLDRILLEYSKVDSDFDGVRKNPEFQRFIDSQQKADEV